jgi:hypothetical protein
MKKHTAARCAWSLVALATVRAAFELLAHGLLVPDDRHAFS